jgi:prepilin-type N-terminal cleavage/methylation domain-containing protein
VNRCRGFTLVEVAVAASVFVVIVFAGVVVSRLAMTTTSRVVEARVESSESFRLLEEARRRLAGASLSSLECVPAGQGMLPEPMEEDTPYDNLTFRHVESYCDGEPVLYPPPGEPPMGFFFTQRAAPGEAGFGDLIFYDGTQKRLLESDVRLVQFVRTGQRVTVDLQVITADGEERTVSGSVVLRIW